MTVPLKTNKHKASANDTIIITYLPGPSIFQELITTRLLLFFSLSFEPIRLVTHIFEVELFTLFQPRIRAIFGAIRRCILQKYNTNLFENFVRKGGKKNDFQ